MKFKYTKIKDQIYLEDTDEIEEYGEEFEYIPSYYDLISAVVDCIFDEYFESGDEKDEKFEIVQKDFILRLIEDFDLLDEIVEYYEDELKEHFKDEAMKNYE